MAPPKRKFPTVLVVVLVLAGALVAAEFGAKAYAEARLSARARAAFPGAAAPKATLEGFPFLPGLVATGSIGDVRIEARDVPIAGVKLDRFALDLRGVVVDRGALFSSGKVKVQRVAKSTVVADLGGAEIARLTGADVSFRDGAVHLSKFGFSVRAKPKTDRGKVSLSAPPLPDFELPVATVLLGCTSASVTIQTSALRVTCEQAKAPPLLFELAEPAPPR